MWRNVVGRLSAEYRDVAGLCAILWDSARQPKHNLHFPAISFPAAEFMGILAIGPPKIHKRYTRLQELLSERCYNNAMLLVRPSLEYLPGYIAALERGWSPDTTRIEAAAEELIEIEQSPEAFFARLDDPEAKAGPVRLPDGTLVQRLPGLHRWLWDGEFSGSIGFRWSPGTPALPPTCLGHIGYSVVPWKRGRGYARAALEQILPEARERNLPYVELIANVDNVASQRVILANGGVLIERFAKEPSLGGGEALRFRIRC